MNWKRMRKFTNPLALLFFINLALIDMAFGWGEDGHKIVCEIAWQELEPRVRTEVIRLLKTEGRYRFFSDSCVWADEIKSDSSWNWAKPLHYVNLPKLADEECVYEEKRDCRPKEDCPEGTPCPPCNCVVSAIDYYAKVLHDPNSNDADKLTALKFVGHFVGDLHQPLHAGFAQDKGGNDRRVKFFGRKTNLHAVWDSGIIHQNGKRWLDYARELSTALAEPQKAKWRKDVRPADWATESHRSVSGVYEGMPEGGAVGQEYVDHQTPVLENQLKKAGVRLGALLNQSLGSPSIDHESLETVTETETEGTTPHVSAMAALEVHVIDVGQGDAILIRCPDGTHEMLIDAGDNRYPQSGDHFKHYMQAHQDSDNPVEVVIASHPHADHIGNMAWVLRTFPVGLYVDNGDVADGKTYQTVETAWEQNGARYWSAKDEMVPDVDFCPRDDVSAVVLRPQGFGEDHDPNNNSVVVRVDYGKSSFLFVGDAEETEERLLLDDPSTCNLLDVDFLKAGHHGSNTSSSNAFLQKVTPKVVAVSCGAKGVSTNARYKHPRSERIESMLSCVEARNGPSATIEAFDTKNEIWKSVALDKAVYVTTTEGSLVFESDGQAIRKR